MPPEQGYEFLDSSTAIYVASLNYLKSRLPAELSQPKVAVICGSGLGGLIESVDETDCKKVEFKYEDIPGFVSSTGKNKISL